MWKKIKGFFFKSVVVVKTVEQELNEVLVDVNQTMGMFTNFVNDLKSHNGKLTEIANDAVKKAFHFNTLGTTAKDQIVANQKMISKVENLIS